MKKILITGATGLLGSEILEMLPVDRPAYALVRNPGKLKALAHIEPILGDLSSESPLNLPDDIDSVLHLAQSEDFRDFPTKAESIYRVNTHSTFQLLEHARKVGARRFVYASTGGVYAPSSNPLTEGSAFASEFGMGFYPVTKLASETLCRSYSKYISVGILRYFFIYGPRQNRSMLLPRLVDQIRSGSPISLQGTRGIRMNPTYVTDAARATLSSLSRAANEIHNIAGPEVTDLRSICEKIAKLVGKDARFENSDAAAQDWVSDISSMSRDLGGPTVDLNHGLQLLIGPRSQ